LTKVTKTPYAVLLPITIQARMTVKPKETVIAFIGLEAALVGMERFAGNSGSRYEERLTYPRLVVLAQAMR